VLVPGDHVERRESKAGHAEIDSSAAAVDDACCAGDLGARSFEDVYYLCGTPASSNDIFDNQRPLTGTHVKSPAEGHMPRYGIALSEDKPRLQRPRDFVADDQAANRGRYYNIDGCVDSGSEFLGQLLSGLRILKHEGALQVLGAVKAAGQAKVAS
jgi:hypothetical protein